MDPGLLDDIAAQIIGSLVGVFVGALAALATARRARHHQQKRRARTLLRILGQELTENYETLQLVKPAYESTSWGKSFYLSMMAWENALASGDLQEILGYELSDHLAVQYGWLARIRYYVDLMTRLWFAPQGIAAYQEIQRGFREAIVAAMEKAETGHQEVMRHIRAEEAKLGGGRVTG
jgi:hypothetical protein